MSDEPDLFSVPAPVKKRRRPAANAVAAGAAVPDDTKATQERKIVTALTLNGPLTYHDIAASTDIELSTVCWRMKSLKASGVVQVALGQDQQPLMRGHSQVGGIGLLAEGGLMAISGRMRVEVFTRDGFACVYCGARSNGTSLHVDHVHPRAAGGRDHIDNYVTACQRCNLGKGGRPIYPGGLSLTGILSAAELTTYLYQAKVSDLVRQPWLRMVILLTQTLQARWDPLWVPDSPVTDLHTYDANVLSALRWMVGCCEAANGDAWLYEAHLCDFARYVGCANSIDEALGSIRRYADYWMQHYYSQPGVE